MIGFEDRVAIVTGAGRGLGAEHAKLLASRGARVVVNDPGGSVHGTDDGSRPADEVVAEITAAGGAAIADYHSVADPGSGEAIVAAAVGEFGKVDILVNNAGILRDRAFHNLAVEDLHAVLDVHLRGAFYVTQPAVRVMREHGYGRIVLTSSASGVLGNFGQSNYGAAKMALIGLMNVLKIEGVKHGIKVNAIAPIAGTRMTQELLGEMADRFDPALVAPAVAYLCSEECALTGELWSVGGGTISRFFIGLTDGYFKDPGSEGPLTIEDVAANLAPIRDETGYLVGESSRDEFTKLAGKLTG
ncbi:MAG: SDR family NAD(P)-dependent oxidoreductase [Actinobacteria bacterium]|nr:SDR family NAD(P)-dependent oxidoreductase [Actinomycetota bacterium]MBU1494610.1 SDR family NAD(P)-dependent oxidoreductase [Actinomycetota bacterium]